MTYIIYDFKSKPAQIEIHTEPNHNINFILIYNAPLIQNIQYSSRVTCVQICSAAPGKEALTASRPCLLHCTLGGAHSPSVCCHSNWPRERVASVWRQHLPCPPPPLSPTGTAPVHPDTLPGAEAPGVAASTDPGPESSWYRHPHLPSRFLAAHL